jgi:hypothetical protein
VEEEKVRPEPLRAEECCDCFCAGIGPEMSRLVREKSHTAREHFRNAALEVLKAFRTLVDDQIDRMSRTEQKGTRIAVD